MIGQGVGYLDKAGAPVGNSILPGLLITSEAAKL